MTILNIQRISVGAVGVSPGRVALTTTDNLATITAAGYLNNNTSAGYLSPLDIVEVFYSVNSAGAGTFEIFTVSVSGGINTLVPWVDGGNVLLPVTNGNFAIFNGTDGQIKNGKAPTDGTQPYVAMSAGSITSFHLLMAADGNGTLFDSNIAANKVLTSAIVTPDVGSNLIAFNVQCTAAALATAGKVNLQVSGTAKQYILASLSLSPGTNFDSGGDRLLAVTDGTSVYSQVPAATMKSQTNAIWSATALPAPSGSATYNTKTVAAANLYAQYVGGTTDYVSGNIWLSGILARVA